MVNSPRRLLHLIGLALGGLLFVYQILNVLPAVMENKLHVSSPAFIGLALAIGVAAIGIQMIAWARLMRAFGIYLSWSQVLRGYTLSFLPRYIPGSVWGYLSRNEWLLQNHNVRYGISNRVSLLEVLSILLSGSLILGAYGVLSSIGFVRFILAASVILLPLLVWLALNKLSVSGVWSRWLRRAPIGKDQVTIRLGLRDWLVIVALYVFFWLCHGSVLLTVAGAIDRSHTASLLAFTSMFTLAWSAGFFVLLVPSGLGVREMTLASLMVGQLGMLASHASAVSVIMRLMSFTSELTWIIAGVLGHFSRDWRR